MRKETATAKGNDAFVVELMKENIDKLDQELQETEKALDWFTFVNKLKT